MATKIHHLQAVPGSRELFTILEIINDKKKFSEALEELESKRKEVNELIDVVGDAEEIKSLHSKVKEDADRAERFAQQRINEANKEFAEAHERTEQLIKDARDKADEIVSVVKAKEDSLDKRTDIFNKESSDKQRDLEARLQEVIKRESEVRKREGEANAKLEEGLRLKSLYEEKIEKIRKLQGEL